MIFKFYQLALFFIMLIFVIHLEYDDAEFDLACNIKFFFLFCDVGFYPLSKCKYVSSSWPLAATCTVGMDFSLSQIASTEKFDSTLGHKVSCCSGTKKPVYL